MTYLETPRLKIVQMIPDDAPRLVELDSDPAVMRFIGPSTATEEEYRERIATVYSGYYTRYRSLGLWCVFTRSSGEFLGWVCLRPALDYRYAAEAGFETDEAELGYRLRQSAWGQGFATEASRAVMARGWETEPITTVVSTALRDNRASTRVMEKCGLQFQREWLVPGFDCPGVVYRRANRRSLLDP